MSKTFKQLSESLAFLEEASVPMPIKGHPYHQKTDAQLQYIVKDAHAAAQAMKDHNPSAEAKYLDQVNDACTVLGYRKRGGKMVAESAHYSQAEITKAAERGANDAKAGRKPDVIGFPYNEVEQAYLSAYHGRDTAHSLAQKAMQKQKSLAGFKESFIDSMISAAHLQGAKDARAGRAPSPAFVENKDDDISAAYMDGYELGKRTAAANAEWLRTNKGR